MTISKKDQEKLIDAISKQIGINLTATVLIDLLKVVVSGEQMDSRHLCDMVTDQTRRILSRYQITEKPN